MKPFSSRENWGIIFGLLLLANLTCIALQFTLLQGFTKALLMPLLGIQLWSAKRHSGERSWKLVLAGLITAWLGDLFLLKGSEPAFFIAGLLSFLTTHVLYIFYFRLYKPPLSENWFRKHPLITMLVVFYSVSYFAILQNKLGPMLIPVAVYCLVITIMLLQALATQKNTQQQVYLLSVPGAIFFVISDSVLAYNKFYETIGWGGLAIMATYGVAQWLITQGAIQNHDHPTEAS